MQDYRGMLQLLDRGSAIKPHSRASMAELQENKGELKKNYVIFNPKNIEIEKTLK